MKAIIILMLAAFIAAGTFALAPRTVATPSSAYLRELTKLERRIAASERLTKAAPRSWMRRAELVGLYLDRASLMGSYADYQSAERELDEALELGPHVPELYLLRAQLSFTLHRFDRVERDLDLPERAARRDGDSAALAGILAMRGSLAFERGDNDEAEKLLLHAFDTRRSYDALARLAHVHVKTGRFERATELFDRAERELDPRAARAHAWLDLQRGLMELDRQRYDEALGWYRSADAAYPGWWLIEEHIAEIDALQGRTDSARERYERLVAETDNPELIDALAALLVPDEPERASLLIDRARGIYEQQLRTFPEATYGHALDHFLEHDPARAVMLAEKNHALRPNAEAKAKLAKAHAKTW